MHDLLEINEKSFDELKALYDKNIDNYSFTFQGNELLTGYAKYLIEYLSTKFKSDVKNQKT